MIRSDISALCRNAQNIWREYYPPIIGAAQTEYMLKKFNTVTAVMQHIMEGYHYFNIFLEKHGIQEEKFPMEWAGYFAVFPADERGFFISKLYVKSNFRGCGIGRDVIHYCKKLADSKKKLILTVNRGNTAAIKFYKKLKFRIVRSADFDIGNSFFMSDYVMTL